MMVVLLTEPPPPPNTPTMTVRDKKYKSLLSSTCFELDTTWLQIVTPYKNKNKTIFL